MHDEPDFLPVHHPDALSYRGCRIRPLPHHTRQFGYGWSCDIPGKPNGGNAPTVEGCKQAIDKWLDALIDQGKETDHAE